MPWAQKGNTESGVRRGLNHDKGGCFDRAGARGNEDVGDGMDWAHKAKISPFGTILFLFYIIIHQLEPF